MSAVNFLWNPLNDNIVEEFDDAGNAIAEYTTESDEFGNVVSQYRDGHERFFHFDGVGSTLALTDAGANITDNRSYSAFGEPTEESGTTSFPFQYIGQKSYYLDTVTVDIRRRVLNIRASRWLASDPAGIHPAELLAGYLYVMNRVTIVTDPSGLAPTCVGAPVPVLPGPTGINNLAQCRAACAALKAAGKLTAPGMIRCLAVCAAMTVWGCIALGKFCYTLKNKQALETCLLLCQGNCAPYEC